MPSVLSGHFRVAVVVTRPVPIETSLRRMDALERQQMSSNTQSQHHTPTSHELATCIRLLREGRQWSQEQLLKFPDPAHVTLPALAVEGGRQLVNSSKLVT